MDIGVLNGRDASQLHPPNPPHQPCCLPPRIPAPPFGQQTLIVVGGARVLYRHEMRQLQDGVPRDETTPATLQSAAYGDGESGDGH